MDNFYKEWERDCALVYKMQEEAKRAELIALFTRETEERQRKLEEEALRKYEEEKKAEELKRAEEEKENKAAGGKG
jgi:hypothetical protein